MPVFASELVKQKVIFYSSRIEISLKFQALKPEYK